MTLEGPALITSEVTATSDVGIYRFINLPPGMYTLRFALSGFSTRVNEGSVFNIFNANTISDVIVSSGAAFDRVLNFLSPRIFRVSVKYSF